MTARVCHCALVSEGTAAVVAVSDTRLEETFLYRKKMCMQHAQSAYNGCLLIVSEDIGLC